MEHTLVTEPDAAQLAVKSAGSDPVRGRNARRVDVRGRGGQVASDDITTEQLVKHAREVIVDSGQDVDDAVLARLARRMSYLSGDVSDAALYRSLAARIGDRQRPVYYLEVPPSLFGPIVEQLGAANLLRDGRVAVEKPFADPGDPTTRKLWSAVTPAGSSRGCPRTAEPEGCYGGSARVCSWVSG